MEAANYVPNAGVAYTMLGCAHISALVYCILWVEREQTGPITYMCRYFEDNRKRGVPGPPLEDPAARVAIATRWDLLPTLDLRLLLMELFESFLSSFLLISSDFLF